MKRQLMTLERWMIRGKGDKGIEEQQCLKRKTTLIKHWHTEGEGWVDGEMEGWMNEWNKCAR